jgi:hypothetical protein
VDRTDQTPAQHSPAQTPGNDVVMRFLTQGDATVELHQQTRTVNYRYGQPGYLLPDGETRVSDGYNWRCLGCGAIGGGGRYGMGARHFDAGQLSECRDEANTHATACRSMPRPAAA